MMRNVFIDVGEINDSIDNEALSAEMCSYREIVQFACTLEQTTDSIEPVEVFWGKDTDLTENIGYVGNRPSLKSGLYKISMLVHAYSGRSGTAITYLYGTPQSQEPFYSNQKRIYQHEILSAIYYLNVPDGETYDIVTKIHMTMGETKTLMSRDGSVLIIERICDSTNTSDNEDNDTPDEDNEDNDTPDEDNEDNDTPDNW